jgi:hypothetical protein
MPDLVIKLRLETNAQEIIQRFERLPGAVQTGVLRGLRGALLVAETNFKLKPGVKLSGGRSGLASRLTSYARKDDIDMIDAAIGFRKTKHFPYELSQEFGATAKPGGAMTVPISDVAKKLSMRGIGPRDGFAQGKLRVIRTSKGAFLAETKTGRRVAFGAALVWHYKLIKRLPARMKFREVMGASIPMISERITVGAREAWLKV